ncbi:MAG: hypothetical protein HQL50_07635 [Magnetococcales bacterium]|nr:hypothetical protein [Magnetococcales bacterium]
MEHHFSDIVRGIAGWFSVVLLVGPMVAAMTLGVRTLSRWSLDMGLLWRRHALAIVSERKHAQDSLQRE